MSTDPEGWDIPGLSHIEPRRGYRVSVRVKREGVEYVIPLWVDAQEVRPPSSSILDKRLGFAAYTNFEDNWQFTPDVRAVGHTEQDAVEKSVKLFLEDHAKVDRWLGLGRKSNVGDSEEFFYPPV